MFQCSKDEIRTVMLLAGFVNEEDAIRALIVREELVKLRKSGGCFLQKNPYLNVLLALKICSLIGIVSGLEAPHAIDELIERMRGLGKKYASLFIHLFSFGSFSSFVFCLHFSFPLFFVPHSFLLSPVLLFLPFSSTLQSHSSALLRYNYYNNYQRNFG